QLLQFVPPATASIQGFRRVFFNDADIRVRKLSVGFGLALVAMLVLAVGVNSYLSSHTRQLAARLSDGELAIVQHAAQGIQQLSGSDRIMVLEQARDAVAD